jgi:hypothetical protein
VGYATFVKARFGLLAPKSFSAVVGDALSIFLLFDNSVTVTLFKFAASSRVRIGICLSGMGKHTFG